MKRRGWIAIAALTCVALGSFALNAALLRMLVDQYRDEQLLRLDPSSSAHAGERAGKPDGGAGSGESRTIVLFGDSRILQWPSFPCPGDSRVVNQGVGNETTAQGLLRLQRDVLDLNPDIVVIQFGVNDLKSVGVLSDQGDRIEAECAANIRRMIDAIRAIGSKVVLLTIIPVGEVPLTRRLVWSDETIDAIDHVNRELREMQNPGVAVLDCDPILRGGRRIRPGFAMDLLHLNPAGYSKLSAAVGPTLESSK